jgi:F-type H+-transporting ATPase subunit gamma
MTERLAELETRVASIRELRDIVGAMRGLAAMRVQEAEHSIASTRAYADIVRASLWRAISLVPDTSGATRPGKPAPGAIVLFGAEHGLAGDFNSRIIRGAGKAAGVLLVVGTRGAAACQERGLSVAWCCPMATHVGAVTVTARRVSEELYRRFSRGAVSAAAIVVARYEGGTRSTVTTDRLLPVDAPPAMPGRGLPPLVNLPPIALVERMLEEYLFAELAHAAMESFASENAARLATMQAARRNIEEKLDQLTMTARAVRQDEITAELLDIATGAEAASRGSSSGTSFDSEGGSHS